MSARKPPGRPWRPLGGWGRPSGQVTLVLARQIDDHVRLTGGALAAVAKQFRDSLGKALEDGPRRRDRVDELRARRMRGTNCP